MRDDTLPNPGSKEALFLGCSCPVIDNGHGQGVYKVDGKPVFWISSDCRLHSELKQKTGAK